MQSSTQLGSWNISLVLGKTPPEVIVAKQNHGNTVISVALCIRSTTEADGLIGTKEDGPFGVLTADCMPLILVTLSRAFALHISRHTIVNGILKETTTQLGREKITGVYIGPHICENCFFFETKGDEIHAFEKIYPYAVTTRGTNTHLSLDAVIRTYLQAHKVSQDSIIQDGRCTFEDTTLPSWKRWLGEGKIGERSTITTIFKNN